MSKLISDSARQHLVDIAVDAGYEVQLKPDGSDVYNKVLMFRAPGLDNYLYIHKDVGISTGGNPNYIVVAVHPAEFRPELVDAPHGISERINQQTGNNLFAHSNYRGFPYYTGHDQPCAKCYRVETHDALAALLKALNGSPTTTRNVIQAITLQNFKGIRDPVRIELKPITLLFGPNSAGKSTILQALVYTREVLERHNLDPDRTLLGGEWMDLGGFDSLIHGHDRSQAMTIGFELDVRNTDLPNYLHDGDSWLLEAAEGGGHFPEEWLSKIQTIGFQLVIRWSALLERPIVERLLIDANERRIAEIAASQDSKDIAIKLLEIRNPIFRDDEYEDLEYSNSLDEVIEFETPPIAIEPGDDIESLETELSSWWFEDLIVDALHEQRTSHWPATDLPLTGQQDALPSPERGLQLDRSVWGSGSGVYANHPLAFQLLISSVLSGLIAGPIDLVRRELDKLIYIGPLREVPSRQPSYRRSPDISRWARGAAAWDVLHNADSNFIDKVNDWLAGEGKLNSGYSIAQHRYRELTTDHPITLAIEQGMLLDEEDLSVSLQSLPVHTRVAIRETKTDLEVYPQDIGVGISQVTPIIVSALAQRSGILAIEQPELHIHPALQVALGDLFASQIADAETLYLLETHSEHLMLRFLRRIRETTDNELPPGTPSLRPDQIAVYFVENSESGIHMTPIRVDENGEFVDRWPRGFFTERRGELM